jgi:hypothetical protein
MANLSGASQRRLDPEVKKALVDVAVETTLAGAG